MMRRSRSGIFLMLLGILVALAAGALLDAHQRRNAADIRLAANRPLARWVAFTDPCLFTDARYARHPSLADPHSPFQDSPLALEHFPSGSLVGAPVEPAIEATP